jgi:hypothetical protein
MAFASTGLLTLANMPIRRFGGWLLSNGRFDDYMRLLRDAHRDENLDAVMCRDLISIDWQRLRLRLRLQSDAQTAPRRRRRWPAARQ